MGGRDVRVDTGFIVFNRRTYPNLTALFELLGVPTEASDMSLSVSSMTRRRNIPAAGFRGCLHNPGSFPPRFWSMLADVARFYRRAAGDAEMLADETFSLGQYLDKGGYGQAFREDHLLPMASAIWSAPPARCCLIPQLRLSAFTPITDFFNSEIARLGDGVRRIAYLRRPPDAILRRQVRRDTAVVRVERMDDGPVVTDSAGRSERYHHVVIAAHADQALALLARPSAEERELLGVFRYSRNLAVLHTDPSFMPKRRSAWSSWNFVGRRDAANDNVTVTYWMNRLQNLSTDMQLFVTLNPPRAPARGTLLHSEIYDHPIFDARAMAAQKRLWSLQGKRHTWFCGSYFGAGFHEDGLQSGLAVAEELGGMQRPWSVPDDSGRIVRTAQPMQAAEQEFSA